MLSSSSEEKWKWTQIRLNLNFKKKKRSNNLQLFKILRASFSINMRLKFRWKHFVVFMLCRETQVCPQWPIAVSFDMFELSVQCQTLCVCSYQVGRSTCRCVEGWRSSVCLVCEKTEMKSWDETSETLTETRAETGPRCHYCDLETVYNTL